MEIIEQIGSYAGLAAIVGLAVLSALYFSQARDVRRLREAEEARAAKGAAREAVKPRPGERPAAAAVAGPVVAKGAQPAGQKQPAAGTGAPPQARPAPVARQPAAQDAGTTPAQASSPADTRQSPAPPAPAGAGAGGGNAAGARPAPPAPAGAGAGGGNAAGARPGPPRLPVPRPAAAPARRSPAATPERRPFYRRLAPRYVALIVAGIVVVGAGTAFGLAALSESDDGSTADTADTAQEGPAPLDPSTITVAVLNGTSVSGLANQFADNVEAAGFQRGNVANATDQASAESAVLFAEGARSAARQVGREVDIAQIEPIDPDTQALAGTADVVVIVGADKVQ